MHKRAERQAAFHCDVTMAIVRNYGNGNFIAAAGELLDAKNSNKGIPKISVRDGRTHLFPT